MKKVYSQIEYLAYYQIIGGIIGILFMINNIFDEFSTNGFYLFSLSVFLAFVPFQFIVGFYSLEKNTQ